MKNTNDHVQSMVTISNWPLFCLMASFVVLFQLICFQVFAVDLPALKFPDGGRVDNIGLLDDYAKAVEAEKSEIANEEKARVWARFARKWRGEKPFHVQGKQRAQEWRDLQKRLGTLDSDWKKLKKLLGNEHLSLEVRKAALIEFTQNMPTGWDKASEVQAAAQELQVDVPSKDTKSVAASDKPGVSASNDNTPGDSASRTVSASVSVSVEAEVGSGNAWESVEAAPTDEQMETLPVKDFCGFKKIGDASKKFVRQRVMLVNVGNTDIFNNGETAKDGESKVHILKTVDASKLFAKMFYSYMPLKRFDTVLSSAISPDSWREKEKLSPSDVRKVLSSPFDWYSVQCSDYIVVAYVDKYDASWGEQEKTHPQTGNKIKVPILNFDAKGILRVFKRGEGGYEHLADLKANSGGLTGFAAGFAGSLSGSVGDPTGVAGMAGSLGLAKKLDFISLQPKQGCQIPETGKDGTAALQCDGDLRTLPEAPGSPGMGEASKANCKNFELIKTQKGAAICAVRKAGELYAISAQKKARGVDGWRLYAEMAKIEDKKEDDKSDGGFELGDAEGVEKGMGFYAIRQGKNGEKERLGYVKITKVGPGGEDGVETLSKLQFRIDKPQVGIRLEEHPQNGFTVGAGSLFFFPLVGRKNIVLDAEGNEALYPPVAMGAELEVGYDLTRYTFSELWVRYRMSVAAAPVTDYDYWVVNMQVGPEARLFMFNRTYWFGSIAGNMTITSLESYDDLISSPSYGSKTKGKATVGGMAFRTGMDVMFNADFYLRFSLGWLQNFKKIKYEDKNENRVFNREDNPSGLDMVLGLHYTI